MKKSMRYTIPLCLLLASTAMAGSLDNTNNSFNKHTGFYAGASAGTSVYYGAFISSGDHNNATGGFNGFGWSGDAGYSFTTTTSLEVGFIQTYIHTTNDTLNDKATISAPYLTARFNIPIGQRFSFIAKTGIMYAHISDDNSNESSDSIVLPFIGVGASYAITHHIAVDATYQGAVYGIVGAGLMSGGVTYNF